MENLELVQKDFEKTLVCKTGTCSATHVIRAICMSTKDLNREFLGMVTLFTRCQDKDDRDSFYVGESDPIGKVVSLLKYPDFKAAMNNFNSVINHYREFADILFDDLDQLLKPNFAGL